MTKHDSLCVLSEKYGMARAEALELADFLLPMLRLEPVLRASAGEMLVHPWLLTL